MVKRVDLVFVDMMARQLRVSRPCVGISVAQVIRVYACAALSNSQLPVCAIVCLVGGQQVAVYIKPGDTDALHKIGHKI